MPRPRSGFAGTAPEPVKILCVKMLLAHTAWKIDTPVSLGVIVLTLAASVVMSLRWPKHRAIAAVPNPAKVS